MITREHLYITEVAERIKEYCRPGTVLYDMREKNKYTYTVIKEYPHFILMRTNIGYMTSFSKFECMKYLRPLDSVNYSLPNYAADDEEEEEEAW